MEALDILLVEDDPYDAELVESFVRRSGHRGIMDARGQRVGLFPRSRSHTTP